MKKKEEEKRERRTEDTEEEKAFLPAASFLPPMGFTVHLMEVAHTFVRAGDILILKKLVLIS